MRLCSTSKSGILCAPPTPVLVVCVAGVEPMPIECQHYTIGFASRLAWRGRVPDRVNRPADYSVAAGDWLLLVEDFDPAAVDRAHH